MMCGLLEVSRGGFYAWGRRPESRRARRHEALAVEIRRAHLNSRGLYGSPRVHQELLAGGVKVCVNTVAKVMRGQGIRSKIHRKFKPRTTDSAHGLPVSKN